MLALVSGSVSIIASYSWFKSSAVSEVERRGLPAYTANAVKHAFAAAETYAILRTLGTGQGWASQAVYRLGQLNEYAEYYGRRSEKRDPTREIYKDFYNNLVGVAAATLLERAHPTPGSVARLALIGQLTADGTIMPSFLDARVPNFDRGGEPQHSDLTSALAAFKQDRAAAGALLLARTPASVLAPG